MEGCWGEGLMRWYVLPSGVKSLTIETTIITSVTSVYRFVESACTYI